MPSIPSLLLVDDDPVMRKFLARILGDDYDVTTAETGREALDQLEALNPDLMVLDLWLPDLDGHEVLRTIRDDDAWKELPILVLSGRERSEERVRSLRLGANDHLVKPFNPEELKVRLDVLRNQTS
jgi:DNA-binding response OmpR family regulator